MNQTVAPSGRQFSWWIRVLCIEDDVLHDTPLREATTERRIFRGEPVSDGAQSRFQVDIATAMVERVRAGRPGDAECLPDVAFVARGIALAVAGWDEVAPTLRRLLETGGSQGDVLEEVWPHLLRWAAWRVLVDARATLPNTLPLTKEARRFPFRDAVKRVGGAKRFDCVRGDAPREAPIKRTVERWIAGHALPQRDQLEFLLKMLDSIDPEAGPTRREELRTHTMLCAVADALREKLHETDVQRLGTLALGIVRRLEAALREALETPPPAMQATLDRIQRDVANSGVTTSPGGWSRIARHFMMLDLWSMAIFGSSRWLTPYALERAAQAPPSDDVAKWLSGLTDTWTWARAVSPPIRPGGGATPTADVVRSALEHGRRFLVSALQPLVLHRLTHRPDGPAWLEVAAHVANDDSSDAADVKTALAIVDEVGHADGVTPRVHLVRGALLLRIDRTEEAEASLRMAADDPACGTHARLLLGLRYEQTRRFDDAVRVLRPIDDPANPDPSVLRALFACHKALGDAESASTVSRRARTLGLSGFKFDRRQRA